MLFTDGPVVIHCKWPFGPGGVKMLYYALMFLFLAVVAGIFGFGGVAGTAAWIAQTLFFLFLVGLIVTVVYNLMHRKRPT
jgi:uncharacterized membrane protein YtjA (UPF0391 family)